VEVAEVLDRVRSIPPGRVAAYSDITPGAPRHAGRVLSESHEPDIPWHRVVRADGTLAKGLRQKELLVAEGVRFVGERVDMKRFRA
jgi:methylated-DNA-protein-cysteine methyltransferase related protein